MPLIPHIQRRIKEKLKSLDLKPDKTIEQFMCENHPYFYTTRCVKNSDQSVYLFRARISSSHLIEKIFQTESIASLFFQKQPGLRKYLRLRELIDWGLTSRLDWAVYEYFPGRVLVEDEIDDKIIDLILHALYTLQTIDVSILSPEIYYQEGVLAEMQYKVTKWWDNRFERYLKILKKVTEELHYARRDEVLRFFKKNYHTLRYAPDCLVHGDFDLNNILLSDGRVLFVDWERVAVANRAYDLSNMFTRTNKPWRNQLIRRYVDNFEKGAKFKKLFRMMVILQCLTKIHAAISGGSSEEEKEAIAFWYQTVDNALVGFTELLGE